MKVAVLGHGYLGSAFGTKEGFDILGKDKLLIKYDDRANVEMLDDILNPYNVIVNCIAKSNTRYCEEHFEDAYFTNSVIPDILSSWCVRNNKKFVHISTGCLYDRNNIPQSENDFLAAHCKYTLTKWIGEQRLHSQDLVIRPRLFFDCSSRPNNLLNKIRKFNKLSCELDSLSSVSLVVNATAHLIRKQCYGVFNVACDGYISMQQIGRMMGLDKPSISIEDIRKEQGIYLVNSIMNLSKLKQFFIPPMIDEELERCIEINESFA